MRAVLPSSRKIPTLGQLPDPAAGPGEVLIEVAATALNRADLLQLRGAYSPPAGESLVPGLECSGQIAALGPGVEGWGVGDRVMALLTGGGHGEQVAVPTGQLMAVPEGLSLEQAAALPEVGVTAWTNLVHEGQLQAGETVLITGAASGVGTFSVQLARELGARVLVAGRSRERLERLRELGASGTVLLGEGFEDEARQVAGEQVIQLVMDLVGGEHLPRSLKVLENRGRLVLVGLLAGVRAELDLADLMRRRLVVRGSVLRSRSREEKAQLVRAFADFALPRLKDGRLRPVVDRVLPFEEIASGYESMLAGGLWGKVVLKLR
ncbi:MAG: NAD(P)H-quinone oxidoreductase [Acidobacteriota bacterium]